MKKQTKTALAIFAFLFAAAVFYRFLYNFYLEGYAKRTFELWPGYALYFSAVLAHGSLGVCFGLISAHFARYKAPLAVKLLSACAGMFLLFMLLSPLGYYFALLGDRTLALILFLDKNAYFYTLLGALAAAPFS